MKKLAAYGHLALFLVSAFLCSVKVLDFLEEVWIGRLKKTSQHKTKGEKNLEKHSDDQFTLDFFGVFFWFWVKVYERF